MVCARCTGVPLLEGRWRPDAPAAPQSFRETDRRRESPRPLGCGVRMPAASPAPSPGGRVCGPRKLAWQLNHLLPAQIGDRIGAESKILMKHRIGVLTEPWGRRACTARRVG